LLNALLLAASTALPPSGWMEACSNGDWQGAYALACLAVEADSTDSDAWAGAAIAAVRGGIDSDALGWSRTAVGMDSLSPLAWASMGVVLGETDPDTAEAVLTKALDLDGDCIPALEGLAGIRMAGGDYAAAAGLLASIIDLNGFYRPACMPLVSALHLSGDSAAALDRAAAFSRSFPEDDDMSLLLGSLLESSGMADSAASVYRRMIGDDSTSVEALRRLGLIEEERGAFGAAVKCYRRLVEADPGYSWAYGELGWCFEAVGSTELARDWYLAGLEIDPDYAWAAYRLGLLVQDEGRPDSARTWFRTALEIDPSIGEAWVSLGLLDEDAGRLEEAARNYRRALEIDPSNAWIWGELGYVYHELGMRDEAASAYEASIEADSSYRWGWEQRGLLYEEEGRTDEAIAWYGLAAMSARQSPWLLGELGMLLEEAGKTDSAAVFFRRSIEEDSLYSFGLQRLARIESRRGNAAEAESLLMRYMSVSGEEGMTLMEIASIRRAAGDAAAADSLERLALEADPDAASVLAWSYLYNRMEEEAVRAGLLAASLAPDDPVGLVSICDLLSYSSRHDLADSLCEAATTRFPDDPAVWRARGIILSTAERYPEAAEVLATAYSLDSTSYEAASGLGEAFLFQNRYDEAKRWLERSLEIAPSAVFSICYLGLIRERMGDPDGALDYYLEALRISPGYAYAEDRIRYISDPSYDVGYWRSKSRRFSASIWADLSFERGNRERSRYRGGAEASWLYGPGGSSLDVEFRGNIERIYTKERENTAWASVGIDYFLTDELYVKAHANWDRQPATVRPWQVSSYTAFGYREWITDWLYVSPEAGLGMVTSQWFIAEKRTDDWTAYMSMGLWMDRDDSLLPSLWLGADLYLPPDDTEGYYAFGNAEISFDAMDRLSLSLGCSLDYTNRPFFSSWEKLDSEIYSRINLSLF